MTAVTVPALHWQPPHTVPHADFPSTRWVTACGKYAVIRTVASYGGEAWAGSDSFTALRGTEIATASYDDRGRRLLDANGTPLTNGPPKRTWQPVEENRAGERRRYRTLGAALTACEQHYRQQVGDFLTNHTAVLAAAEAAGLDHLPSRTEKRLEKPDVALDLNDSPAHNSNEQVASVTLCFPKGAPMSATATATKLTIDLADLQKLFVALGFKMATSWLADNARWPKKLQQLPAACADKTGPIGQAADQLDANSAEKKLLDELLGALQNDVEMKIEGATTAKAATKPAATKAAPKSAATKAATKPATAKAAKKGAKTPGSGDNKAGAARDKFGSRLGTILSNFNLAITRKPKSMRELCDEIGYQGTCYEQVDKLIAGNHVVKTDDNKFKLA